MRPRQISGRNYSLRSRGRSISGSVVNWVDAWTLGTGQKPSAVLDFANARYYDGANNNAVLSTLVQNATVDAGGLITNAGNINLIGSFLTAMKNAGGATVVAEISGGNNTAAYGILSMSSGGPDSIMIANGPNNGGTMDSYNGTSIPGPVTGVDFTKLATFAASYDNAGAINDATAGVIATAAKNFSAITAAQLGSYAGASLWPGRIRSIPIYTGALAANYLKNMSWPGVWNKPFNGNTAVNFNGSGWIGCGNTLASYFKSNAAWSMVAGGMLPSIGSIAVLFTNVSQTGAPPWYGHECYVNTNGKLRVSIFGGWAGGAATTNLIQVDGSTVIDSKWHAIGVTYDGSGLASGIKIYIDGVPDTLTTNFDNLTGASDTLIGEFEIGGQFGDFGYGVIDFFSMSKVARNAAYFTAISATRTRPAIDGNTLAYYDFREGSGTTTADHSGNGNTGTLHSASFV